MVPRGKYTKMRWSYIIGYVDHLDVVHSECFNLLDKDDFEIPVHNEQFGMVLKGWRWDFDKGLGATLGDRLDPEDRDRIRQHLEDVYGIPFYENGFHDVMLICKKMDEEAIEFPDDV